MKPVTLQTNKNKKTNSAAGVALSQTLALKEEFVPNPFGQEGHPVIPNSSSFFLLFHYSKK